MAGRRVALLAAGNAGLQDLTLHFFRCTLKSSCCKYPDLLALLKLRLLTTPCHLLRLLDLRGSHL